MTNKPDSATKEIASLELSVLIPITERHDNIKAIHSAYKAGVESTGLSHEFVYILDGQYPEALRDLMQLKGDGQRITIIKFAKSFGEATALMAGFENTSAPVILTLPAYFQVDPSEIPRLVSLLEGNDMVIARRWPRDDSFLNRLQSRIFHLPIKLITEINFQDLGCSVRVIRRRVVDELSIYGDQHRFLPLLAYRQGFKVIQSDAIQAEQDRKTRLYPMGVYLRRFLDVLSIFFLLKFTKKPMRFFGLLGSGITGAGLCILLVMAIQRMALSVPLSDRPLLLLGSLLLVLGIQVFAIGLVGEIIIFTHAKDIREYTIEEILN